MRNLQAVKKKVFDQFTTDAARSRRCVGWVANTYHGTVRGVVQGKPADVEFMYVE